MTFPCRSRSKTGYICTLPQKHEGDHVAQGTTGRECARWSARDTQRAPAAQALIDKAYNLEAERDRYKHERDVLAEALRNCESMCSCTVRERDSGHLLECPVTYIRQVLSTLQD